MVRIAPLDMVWLMMFWCMQAIAQIFFKWGSGAPERWWFGFFGGHAFGVSSIWLLMLVYQSMNPNVALGLGTGGGFLLAQLALAVIFHSKVSALQCTGIAAITAGMVMLVTGPKP